MGIFGHPGWQQLSRRVDRMLGPKATLALERHLDGCTDCRMKAEALFRLKKRLQDLPSIEEGFVSQMPTPLLVPVVGPNGLLLLKGLSLGFLVVIGFIVSVVVFWPAPLAMRIISSSPQVVSSEGILCPPLQLDTALRFLPNMLGGHVDLEIPGQLLLRLKPGTMITWQQVNRSWLSGRPNIVVNLMRGELIARTQESFWGSRLELRTPTATTMVKGTAFALKVDPSQDTTTVKVLAGSVFFSPYLGKIGVKVHGGQMSRSQSAQLPERPEALSPDERKALLEAYQIGHDPIAALVIGDGPERVEELLRPALLYLSRWRSQNPELQRFLRKTVERVDATVLNGGDLAQHEEDLKILEMAAESVRDTNLAVPLRLFLGSCTAHLGHLSRARTHFYWVVEQCPKDRLAPLAMAAIAVTSERQLKNLDSARETFHYLLARYPKSPEADLAREFLRKHPR